jgi:hypothetical protein
MSNPQFQELLKESTPAAQQVEGSSQSEVLSLSGGSSEKPTGFVERVKDQLNLLQN